MSFIKDRGSFLGVYVCAAAVLGAFVVSYITLGLVSQTGSRLEVSNIIADHAWEKALRTDSSHSKPFTVSKKAEPILPSDAPVLNGISGEAQVHTDAIPVASYKGAVVPANNSRQRQLLKNVSAGDVIRIVNDEGKVIYYQVVRQASENKSKMCGDLRISQKDTKLADCELNKDKGMLRGGFILRRLPVPEVQDLLKKGAKTQQQL